MPQHSGIFTSHPFAPTRRLVLALGLLALATTLGLFAPFARLGHDGQEWALTTSCPVCVTASALIGPIAAVESASKVALYMIVTGLILGGLTGISLLDSRTATLTQATVTAIASLIVACSPLVFDRLLPAQVPIHLSSGGWSVLFLGVTSFVLASMVGFSLMDEERRRRGGDDDDDDEEEEEQQQQKRLPPTPFVASTYGSIRDPQQRW